MILTKLKFKDKEHLNLRCLVQVGPGEHRAHTQGQVLNQCIVFPERRVKSLAVCMLDKNKQCSNFFTPRICRSTAGNNTFGVHGL